MFKKLHIGINEEAYNNRDMVKNTWKLAKFNKTPHNETDYNYKTDYNHKIMVINKIQLLLDDIISSSYLFLTI